MTLPNPTDTIMELATLVAIPGEGTRYLTTDRAGRKKPGRCDGFPQCIEDHSTLLRIAQSLSPDNSRFERRTVVP